MDFPLDFGEWLGGVTLDACCARRVVLLKPETKAVRHLVDACSRACWLLILPTRCRLLPDQLGVDYLPARLNGQLRAQRQRTH
jgi:hypothetical protein